MIFRHLPRLAVLAVGLAFIATVLLAESEVTERRPDDEDDAPTPDDAGNLRVVLEHHELFRTLAMAVKAADLDHRLEEDGELTIFAPTDDAFGALGEPFDELLAAPQRLAEVLQGHIVVGRILAKDLQDGMELETLVGTTLTVRVREDGITVAGANVSRADVRASNGIVHGIDTVLQTGAPRDAAESPGEPEPGGSKNKKKKPKKKKDTES